MNADECRATLRARIDARLSGTPGAEWLASAPADLDGARGVMPDVPGKVGRKALVASFAERADARVEAVWGPVGVGEWTVDGAVRVLLLANAAGGATDPYDALFTAYDLGDTDTRVAALRAVNFVPKQDPARALEMVLDAGRTYLTQLMSAAWCNNPFSAHSLSDHDYRKAILKAFFCDVPVEGFLRLEERADAELAQSLCEYIDERLAAGRTVPSAIWVIAALHPRPGLVGRLIGNLEHPNALERLAAARALKNAHDARALTFVSERLERESDPDVREALAAAQSTLQES